MERFLQTSAVQTDPHGGVSALISKPVAVRLSDAEVPSLHYWVQGAIKLGSTVQYRLVDGLSTVSWSARITRLRDDQYLEAEISDGPFKRFVAYHYFRPFGNGHMVIRDHFEYECEASLSELLLKARMEYTPSSEDRTAAIEVINEQTA